MVEGTAFEKRHRSNPIVSTNLPLTAVLLIRLMKPTTAASGASPKAMGG